jgi:hypothetical protein
MMQIKLVVIGIGVGVLLVAALVPLSAHHAFAAEFDASSPIELTGTVVKMEWVNPHSWIHIDVTQPDGSLGRWMIEGGPPTALLRRGFTKDSLQAGTEVFVAGFRAKDGSQKANGRDVTFSDGSKLFLGSSGTGAPRDGRDATER